MKNEFSQLLKHLRISKGLSVRQLAARTRLSVIYLYTIESPDKPAVPSIEAIRRISEALGSTDEEKAEIFKKLVTARTRAKIPEEAGELRDVLDEEKLEEFVSADSMPLSFIERLRADMAGRGIEELSDRAGINPALLEAVLQYRGILSRRDVIALAGALGQPVQEYLLLANYIPDDVKRLLEKNRVTALLRSLEDLSDEDMADLLDGIIQVIEAYKRRVSHAATGNKGPREKIPQGE